MNMNKIKKHTMTVGQTILGVSMGKNQKERVKDLVLCAKNEINLLVNDDKYEMKNNVVFILAHIDRIVDSILKEVE